VSEGKASFDAATLNRWKILYCPRPSLISQARSFFDFGSRYSWHTAGHPSATWVSGKSGRFVFPFNRVHFTPSSSASPIDSQSTAPRSSFNIEAGGSAP
jgi:hypothetical protein